MKCKSEILTSVTILWILTVPFPITLIFSSPSLISTIFIPESCISSATSLDIIVPFSTKTSPVDGSTILSAASFPAILEAKLNFLLNL